MSDVKQVIVVRKDLKMPVGKIAAQVAHASMGAVKGLMTVSVVNDADGNPSVKSWRLTCAKFSVLWKWWEGEFTKVVLECNSLEELIELEKAAVEQNLPVCLITDSGHTVFNGQPTTTCLAIGPYKSEDINKLTGKLKLYR